MIGFSELIVIIIIAIAVLKPDKLPEYAQAIKNALRTTQQVKNEAKEMVSPVTDIANEVKNEISDIQETTILGNEEGANNERIN